MALRTSWLARPPTAATKGGRVPLAVLARQRTSSVFKEALEDTRAKGKIRLKIKCKEIYDHKEDC